jgi:hypothetical protein
MRYLIPIVGAADPALRVTYVTRFGSACYMSEANMSQASTFNCFYRSIKKACEDAVLIGEVSGNLAYDKGYTCQEVGNGDYWLQIGPDVANKLFIYLMDAPRQTPFIDVNGTPTEINGPYRNLVDPNQVEPGNPFDRPSGMFNDKGLALDQKKWVLEVNRKAHGGKIHSDLAGFMFPCEKGKPEICTEPDFLEDPFDPVGTKPNVHHVVPMKDPRCCPWGTNSYKNAAVISAKLNQHFTNNDPPLDEVLLVNKIPAYTP